MDKCNNCEKKINLDEDEYARCNTCNKIFCEQCLNKCMESFGVDLEFNGSIRRECHDCIEEWERDKKRISD